MKLDTQGKSVAILRAIEQRLQDQSVQCHMATELKRPVIGFDPDVWGANTWTVWAGDNHTHVGYPDGSFEQLVDSLYDLLCEKKGLSWYEKFE